jgi:hypothetical protein
MPEKQGFCDCRKKLEDKLKDKYGQTGGERGSMNRVYLVSNKDGCVYYPVGGEKPTKAILSYLNEIGENASDFIDYRAILARGYDGKPIPTDNTGLLDAEELMSKGYRAWWECEGCGADGTTKQCFEYVHPEKYKCKECGYVGDIPYSDE